MAVVMMARRRGTSALLVAVVAALAFTAVMYGIASSFSSFAGSATPMVRAKTAVRRLVPARLRITDSIELQQVNDDDSSARATGGAAVAATFGFFFVPVVKGFTLAVVLGSLAYIASMLKPKDGENPAMADIASYVRLAGGFAVQFYNAVLGFTDEYMNAKPPTTT